ncbi:hypothetical protein NKI09_23825 [Mesorhizobium sp. M0757]|uniref:hypothetical protein n=1 Tax=unclassified Mesorhizobium TaxID=325217 RepID=UPI0012DC9E28|nr:MULTISPECIES: hypothetical protein [unclassified Mesorhizobium]
MSALQKYSVPHIYLLQFSASRYPLEEANVHASLLILVGKSKILLLKGAKSVRQELLGKRELTHAQ